MKYSAALPTQTLLHDETELKGMKSPHDSQAACPSSEKLLL